MNRCATGGASGWKGRGLWVLGVLLALALVVAGRAQGLVNLSARGLVDGAGGVVAAGFVIAGPTPKRVLVRAAGPALAGFGVPRAAEGVRLDLYRGAVLRVSNSGWDAGAGAAQVRETTQVVGAFPFAAGSRDAALVLALEPGSYTALVSLAAGAGAGVALVEIYDAETTSGSRLVNLSARARVGADAETFIAGFVVAGGERRRMLVRGIGPSLGAFGVADALEDPQLEVFRGSTSVGYNDDWMASANQVQVAKVAQGAGTFALAAAAADAALVLPGARGAYTAHVTPSGAGRTGTALIEVYDTAGAGSLPPARNFDLVGFGRVAGHGLAALSGGGLPSTPYDPVTRTGNFWRIDDEVIAAAGAGFAAQLQAALTSDSPLVVELETMLDLSRYGRPNNGATAIAHPDLFAAGRTTGTVGTLSLGSNKTIYSVYGGGGFRRGSLSISGKSNLMLRNLRFRELWEWDDATRGEYDRNDWDYLTVTSATGAAGVTARAHHVWIDHCDFEKSYDGLFDIVRGTDLVTVSWCKIGGMVSGETIRWVRRQFDHLEANRTAFPYYHSLRASRSVAELLRRETFQKKSNLVGNSADAATAALDTGYLNVTFHHNWYVSVDQRMPRLRFGNGHVFNLLADSRAGRGAADLSLMAVAATSNGAVRVENSRFLDVKAPVTIVAGTEPVGRVMLIGCLNLETATGADLGFDTTRVTPAAAFRWNPPAAATGLGAWPQADSAVLPEGYVPTGRTFADYLDANDAMIADLANVGVVVPADEAGAEILRQRWRTGTQR
ncbi:MAG: hypothetical protein HZC55_06425 [Verrucomicrobia bacterium]|nr:hypothetical protein [Verrucomicrobiota bacterium]